MDSGSEPYITFKDGAEVTLDLGKGPKDFKFKAAYSEVELLLAENTNACAESSFQHDSQRKLKPVETPEKNYQEAFAKIARLRSNPDRIQKDQERGWMALRLQEIEKEAVKDQDKLVCQLNGGNFADGNCAYPERCLAKSQDDQEECTVKRYCLSDDKTCSKILNPFLRFDKEKSIVRPTNVKELGFGGDVVWLRMELDDSQCSGKCGVVNTHYSEDPQLRDLSVANICRSDEFDRDKYPDGFILACGVTPSADGKTGDKFGTFHRGLFADRQTFQCCTDTDTDRGCSQKVGTE